MYKMKKLCAILASAAMLFGSWSVSNVFAQEIQNQANNAGYTEQVNPAEETGIAALAAIEESVEAIAFRDAVAAGGEVTLAQNIELGSPIIIDKDVIIHGGGNSISNPAGNVFEIAASIQFTADNLTIQATASTGRAINVQRGIAPSISTTGVTMNVGQRGISFYGTDQTDVPNYISNASVDLKDTNIYCSRITDYDTDTVIGDTRGLSLFGMKNSPVTLDNCEIKGFGYSINVSAFQNEDGITDSSGSSVTVKNSEIFGWAAFNIWSSYMTFTVENSILKGINTSSGASNGFATIVSNNDLYNQFDELHAFGNIFNIKDSTITNYQSGASSENLLRIDCGIDRLNLSGNVSFIDTTGNVDSSVYLSTMGLEDYQNFIAGNVYIEDGATITSVVQKDGIQKDIPLLPHYTASFEYDGETYWYPSMRSALEDIDYVNTQPGYMWGIDTLEIQPGTYDGDITLPSEYPLSLVGKEGELPVINGKITLENGTGDYALKNLKFEYAADKGYAPALIAVNNTGNFTLDGCTFSAAAVTDRKNIGVRTAANLNVGGIATVTNNTFTGVENGYYNDIEFGISNGNSVADGTSVSGNNFAAASQNNNISFYNIQDKANITISDNTFVFAGNALRLSNPKNAAAVFTIENNSYGTTTPGDYAGFLLLQDYSKDSSQDFTKFTINFKDLTYNGKTMMSNGKGDQQVYYVYDDSKGILTDRNQPVVNFGAANVKVESTADGADVSVTLPNLSGSLEEEVQQSIANNEPAVFYPEVKTVTSPSIVQDETVEKVQYTADIKIVKNVNGATSVVAGVTNQLVTLVVPFYFADGIQPEDVEILHNGTERIDAVSVSGNTVSFVAPSFSEYTVKVATANLEASDTANAAENAELIFEPLKGNDPSSTVYAIYLKSTEADKKITNLAAAELVAAFAKNGLDVFAEINGANGYQVTSVNTGSGVQYLFNLPEGDPALIKTKTGDQVQIGIVTITGYTHTTDGIENSAVLNITNASAEYEGSDSLRHTITVADASLTYSRQEASTALTVEISFPNTVEDQAAAYQQMTITIAGAGKNYTTVLGTDKAAMKDGKYTIKQTVPAGALYTVTVSGKGYRTAKQTVLAAQDTTVYFWNNVYDTGSILPGGTAATDTNKKNFLAGDIVNDGKINIYDLSAVVSYFGEIDLTADPSKAEYAKYDLNRDGKIDSKDVAMVLVSWGE